MNFISFLRREAPWLSAGALMSLSSSFGQTFFIALYAGLWREEFGLSHGEWGVIYMSATIASAALLTQAGRLADVMEARKLAMYIFAGFALVALGVALTPAWWALAPLVFGLRFCGQGMLSHLSVTSMGKWFRRERARAMAIAALGFSVGEALLPMLALVVIGAAGWRGSWVIIACALLFIVAPLMFWLLRNDRTPRGGVAETTLTPGMDGRFWTRNEMLRHWSAWALLPAVFAPGWVGTVIFFQTAHMVEVKGWDMVAYTGLAFPAHSATAILISFLAGWAADRFGALRLVPFMLLGHAGGAFLFATSESLAGGVLAMAALGCGSGSAGLIAGAMLADVYGTRWLGSIRALTGAVSVLASALGPGLSGALLDFDVGIEAQFAGMGAAMAGLSLWLAFVSWRLRPLTPPRD